MITFNPVSNLFPTCFKPVSNLFEGEKSFIAYNFLTVPGGKCGARVDVAIVIDNSGSIEARNRDGFFSRVKTFAKHVYRSFQVGSNADIAVIEAGTDPKIIFNFDTYKDILSMDSAVNKIEHKKQRSLLGMFSYGFSYCSRKLFAYFLLPPYLFQNLYDLLVVLSTRKY